MKQDVTNVTELDKTWSEKSIIIGPIRYFPGLKTKYKWEYWRNGELIEKGKVNTFNEAQEKIKKYWEYREQ